MGEALFPKAQRGYVKIHRWKKYEINSLTTYTWNRWNLVSTTIYRWNKWSSKRVYHSYNTRYSTAPGGTWVWDSYTYNGNPNDLFPFTGIGAHFKQSNTILMSRCRIDQFGAAGEDIKIGDSVTVFESIITNSSDYISYNVDIHEIILGKGDTSYGTVTSTNQSAYPSNGVAGPYWYEPSGSTTSYSKGSTSYPDVTSTDPNAYPNGNHDGSYWYDNRTSENSYSQGTYITDVVSTDPNAYPSNGIYGSYWYVYDGVS